MTGGRGRTAKGARAVTRAQISDFLPRFRRDGSHLTPERVERLRARIADLWALSGGGGLVRVLEIQSIAAPSDHPDAFPFGDGVRRDGRAVMAVIIEYDIGAAGAAVRAGEGDGPGERAQDAATPGPVAALAAGMDAGAADMPPRPAQASGAGEAAAIFETLRSDYAAYFAGAVCECGAVKAADSHGCDRCELDIPF